MHLNCIKTIQVRFNISSIRETIGTSNTGTNLLGMDSIK